MPRRKPLPGTFHQIEPYLWRKIRKGKPYGAYFTMQGDRKVNLKTDELATARKRAREHAPGNPETAPAPKESFAHTPQGAEDKARSILENWSAPVAPPSVDDGPDEPDDTPPLPAPFFSPPPPPEAPKFGKLAEAMANVMTQLNAAGVGLAVRAFGRKPPLPDDDDLETLRLGWEMQLQEWFVETPPKPWMVIGVGSAALGVSLYAQGEPLPPKKKPTLGEAPAEEKPFEPRLSA